MIPRRYLSILTCSLVATACASLSGGVSPLVHQQCYNPTVQLTDVLNELQKARAMGCEPSQHAGQSECDVYEVEVRRLATICPGSQSVLMANAVISNDEHRPEEAQQFLDQILSQTGSHPDAAALRGQIAIEAGNVPYALRMLDEQIVLAPAHAGLRETHAAALYVDNRFDEARSELALAERLGAQRWRIAYHLGLIEEATGHRDEASRLYSESLVGNPGFAPADARLRALQAGSGARP